MQHISEIINEILVEWAYRVHDGMPNPKNVQHIQELRESMEELNLPNKVIYEVIQNLINEEEDGLSDENDDFGLAFTWDHEDYSTMVSCDGDDVPSWYTTYVGDGNCDEMFFCEEYGFDGDDCNQVDDEDESFEGDTLPDGWSQNDADGDGYGWGLWTSFPHSGAQCISSSSYLNSVGALTPDNWLISNAILNSARALSVKFNLA